MSASLATPHLSATFAALADPTRRAIVARLAEGEATVGELARPFAMSGPAITKHLTVLEHAGLIERGRRAQTRPCRLKPAALHEAADWITTFRRFWEDSFDRLEQHLATVMTEEKPVKQEKEP
jgi:DNA-binding transcriptional ArsR family regulator